MLLNLIKPLFNGLLVLIYYFKKYFNPVFFILKTFCSTLNSWIGELENSIFDVKNRLLICDFGSDFSRHVSMPKLKKAYRSSSHKPVEISIWLEQIFHCHNLGSWSFSSLIFEKHFLKYTDDDTLFLLLIGTCPILQTRTSVFTTHEISFLQFLKSTCCFFSFCFDLAVVSVKFYVWISKACQNFLKKCQQCSYEKKTSSCLKITKLVTLNWVSWWACFCAFVKGAPGWDQLLNQDNNKVWKLKIIEINFWFSWFFAFSNLLE